jgi:hypothetical protein
MKALFGPRGRNLVLSCATLSLLMAPPAVRPAAADTSGIEDSLTVVLDEARLVRMPDRVATLVVGNPLIADVSIQPGGLMVLTGKGYGRTNLIALDRSGNKLLEKSLLVKRPGEVVTVYRGILRETYSCAPQCEPRNMPGDAPAFFNTTLNQTVTRNNQASAIK